MLQGGRCGWQKDVGLNLSFSYSGSFSSVCFLLFCPLRKPLWELSHTFHIYMVSLLCAVFLHTLFRALIRGLPTFITPKGFLLSMDSSAVLKAWAVTEGSSTLLTLIRLLPSVDYFMFGKVRAATESLPTLSTPVGILCLGSLNSHILQTHSCLSPMWILWCTGRQCLNWEGLPQSAHKASPQCGFSVSQ